MAEAMIIMTTQIAQRRKEEQVGVRMKIMLCEKPINHTDIDIKLTLLVYTDRPEPK